MERRVSEDAAAQYSGKTSNGNEQGNEAKKTFPLHKKLNSSSESKEQFALKIKSFFTLDLLKVHRMINHLMIFIN